MEVAATPPPAARIGSPIRTTQQSPLSVSCRSPSPICRSPSPPPSVVASQALSRSLLPNRQLNSPDSERQSLHTPPGRHIHPASPPRSSHMPLSSVQPPHSSPGGVHINPLTAAAIAGHHPGMLGNNAFPVPLPSTPTSVAMMAAAAAAAVGPHGLSMPPKPTYSSPPPAPNNSDNNTCSQIDYRGARVAAFVVDGRQLICLPQAFELFLKHLVGGLHTVYTKLKRLDITPIVCNVEQVRILRGLGAIQPGVNRCKLIAPNEFDVLYEDCTNSK